MEFLAVLPIFLASQLLSRTSTLALYRGGKDSGSRRSSPLLPKFPLLTPGHLPWKQRAALAQPTPSSPPITRSLTGLSHGPKRKPSLLNKAITITSPVSKMPVTLWS